MTQEMSSGRTRRRTETHTTIRTKKETEEGERQGRANTVTATPLTERLLVDPPGPHVRSRLLSRPLILLLLAILCGFEDGGRSFLTPFPLHFPSVDSW